MITELKPYAFIDEELDTETGRYVLYAYDVSGNRTPADDTEQIYLKSDVDKVIAELKRENERLVKRCAKYEKLRHCIRWKKRWLTIAEKFKEPK